MSRLARLIAATLIGIGGLVHLQLWRGGYRVIPHIGALFMANAIASGIVAVALVVRGKRLVAVAGMALSFGSLVGLGLSHTVGLLGYMEQGLSSAALRTIAAEAGALVTLTLVVLTTKRSRPSALETAAPPPKPAWPVIADAGRP